jgi:hypothetical protein
VEPVVTFIIMLGGSSRQWCLVPSARIACQVAVTLLLIRTDVMIVYGKTKEVKTNLFRYIGVALPD